MHKILIASSDENFPYIWSHIHFIKLKDIEINNGAGFAYKIEHNCSSIWFLVFVWKECAIERRPSTPQVFFSYSMHLGLSWAFFICSSNSFEKYSIILWKKKQQITIFVVHRRVFPCFHLTWTDEEINFSRSRQSTHNHLHICATLFKSVDAGNVRFRALNLCLARFCAIVYKLYVLIRINMLFSWFNHFQRLI